MSFSLHRARRRSALARGVQIPLTSAAAQRFGLEVWRIRSRAGLPVGYLRLASFRPRLDEGAGAELAPTELSPALAEAMAVLSGVDHWIIDLTGNPGGSWHEAGVFISYFLDEDEPVVPHDVCSVTEPRGFLLLVRTRETHRLARADVPRMTPADVLVLVDQDTASAGEIVASALRGKVGARLVGERTAGAEFSTAEFRAPDGSLLRIGLSGGMVPPLESFQGRGLEPDVAIEPDVAPLEPFDLEPWRATFRFKALGVALNLLDEGAQAR